MSIESAYTNLNTVGEISAVVRNLKTLYDLEERGTKKEYDKFLEKFQNHITVNMRLVVDKEVVPN